MNRSFCMLLILGVLLVLSGCGQLKPQTDPLLDQKARFLAGQARSYNQHIQAGKGTGWIRLEENNKIKRYKIAWAAVAPSKIRMTFLFSGQPVETILATGETITFFSHTGEHATHQSNSKDPDMTDYIKIPIRMSDMISVLLGRLPVQPFDTARFLYRADARTAIEMKKKWKGSRQVLYLSADHRPDQIQVVGHDALPVYDMHILEYRTIDGSEIPARIQLTDRRSRKLSLDIISFQPNPPIKDTIFRLTEPG